MKDFLLKIDIIFLPVFLVLILLPVTVLNIYVKGAINKNSILTSPFSSFAPSPYPILKKKENPKLSASAAIVLDRDSGVVLFAKNANLRFSPASTTKIMTALTALGHFKLTDVLTVRTADVEGSILGLSKGEKMTFEDLLYAMMLPSANDAAIAISQNYPGGEKAFVKQMNKNAEDSHLYNTSFSDPAGLLDDKDYTSAFDLARLAGIALNNKTLSLVVATKHRVVSNIDGTIDYSIYNLNKLLGIDGVNGVKTGYTDEAGGVLATSAVLNGHEIIIVVMKSEDRFLDTEKLINLVSGNVTYLSIYP